MSKLTAEQRAEISGIVDEVKDNGMWLLLDYEGDEAEADIAQLAYDRTNLRHAARTLLTALEDAERRVGVLEAEREAAPHDRMCSAILNYRPRRKCDCWKSKTPTTDKADK